MARPLIIDDETLTDPRVRDLVFHPVKGRGLEPRDWAAFPRAAFADPSDMRLVPRSDWSEVVQRQGELGARVSDILLTGDAGRPIPSLDQGPNGYCWGHSTVGCVQAVRALGGQPYVPLSAYAVCATIMKGKNEGGWCGLSAKFLRERGVPSQELWPQGDRDYERYDTPEVWANAALHVVTEEWCDITAPVHDTDMTWDQFASALLTGSPCAADWMWWGHSTMACDLVEVEPGSFGVRIRNSWGDSWGDSGFAVLRGSQAKPDNALAIRVAGASPV